MSNWPHAPSHQVDHPGSYIITAGTQYKERLFDTDAKLSMLEDVLLRTLEQLGWGVQAWAVFQNHYHVVGHSPDTGLGLTELTRRIHGESARLLNQIDGVRGRQVWYRAWDTRLSFERSYLARLAYVHQNAVKHGLVDDAQQYPWCSARWFFLRAEQPFYRTVMSFKTDQVNVIDDF